MGGKNKRFSSNADYAHWNEEAPIIRALEDRATEYYYEERDYNDERDDD